MSVEASGIGSGERRLNGVQTSGRDYRNLSEPEFAMRRTNDVCVAMRDGTTLMADLFQPDAEGRFPALLSFSPYPRQIQDVGAPLGFIEAGASDFFVPRGYVHLIVNARGTGGSGGDVDASSTSRSGTTSTISSNGWRRSPGATAMSACSASATSPWRSSRRR